MAGMPDQIETSTSRGGAARFFNAVEVWLNDPNPATRKNNRTQARAKVGGFAGITTTLSGGMTSGGLSHFDAHWRGGTSGWWPSINKDRVNSQLSSAFGAALAKVLEPGKEHLNIRLKWDCTYRDLNADDAHFWATAREEATEMWIEITSPRAPGGITDQEMDLVNYGFSPSSNLPPKTYGLFTVLGDHEVANYDGTEGTHTINDEVTTRGYRESWSFFPVRERVENGSQGLTGLSYTRDTWRPVSEGVFEDEPLHRETGYLLWDEENSEAYRVIALPRGVTLVAVARGITADSRNLTFVADDSDDRSNGGIVSNPILFRSARTVRFESTMRIDDEGGSFYYEDTTEQARDEQSENVRHVNTNTVSRI